MRVETKVAWLTGALASLAATGEAIAVEPVATRGPGGEPGGKGGLVAALRIKIALTPSPSE